MKRVLILALALLFFGACKKSVESESKRFETNKQRLSELKALYPGFAKPLTARLAKGEKLAKEAREMGDEEAAAEKLSSANKALLGGFVSDLDDVEEKVNGLKAKMVEAATSAADKATGAGAKVASDQAGKTLAAVEAALKQGATDEAGAKAIAGKALRDLAAAEKNLGTVVSAGKGKTTKAETGKAEAKAAKANWTCGYCQKSNPHHEHKCTGCGAGRTVAPAK
ncbi:MAG: hypothetical protein ACI9WU_001648 [Myxococcota bacterium]|jgi:hypothetical protein